MHLLADERNREAVEILISLRGVLQGGPGVGADPGAVLEEDLFEGPVLVGPEDGGGSDLAGGPVLGFPDQEDQIVAGPVEELVGGLGFGGGVDLGGLKLLNLLHITYRLVTDIL